MVWVFETSIQVLLDDVEGGICEGDVHVHVGYIFTVPIPDIILRLSNPHFLASYESSTLPLRLIHSAIPDAI